MGTKIKRRYTNQKTEEYKIYSDQFDKCTLESNVLNRPHIPSISTIFWDKNNLKTEIELFETEVIPARQATLMAAHDAFTSYQIGRKREGKTVTEEWPTHLLERRCLAEARLDVAKREKEFLEERLEKYYEKPEAELEEKGILEYGPIGRGRLKDGVLVELDGQKIEPFKTEDDEILVITSKTSPYYGLAVTDYRAHVIVPFTLARRKRQYELEKQRQAEIAETGHSKIVVPPSGRKIHPSSLPVWPIGVKNYFAINEEVNEAEEENVETSNLVQ